MKLGIHWLTSDMDQNHDLFPEGYGIMEVSGLNAELIDVAVYTEEALKATARVARLMGEPDWRPVRPTHHNWPRESTNVSGSRRRPPTRISTGPENRR